MASEWSIATPPAVANDVFRWMSPELLHSRKFGLEECRPTKESDCYALGMVIYEVLSGQVPFAPCRDSEVTSKVLGGKHPVRPEGRLFTNDVWKLLGSCWKPQPNDRPNAKTILLGLEAISQKPNPKKAHTSDGFARSVTARFSRVTPSRLLSYSS